VTAETAIVALPRRASPLAPLLADLERLCTDLAPEAVPPVLAALGSLQAALAARLLATPAIPTTPQLESDRLLKAPEAADLLGDSLGRLYRKARPGGPYAGFAVRQGLHSVRFSAQGIQRWIRRRRGA
jgi:hypothetical protein